MNLSKHISRHSRIDSVMLNHDRWHILYLGIGSEKGSYGASKTGFAVSSVYCHEYTFGRKKKVIFKCCQLSFHSIGY